MSLDFETILTALEKNITYIHPKFEETEWESFTENFDRLGEKVAKVSSLEELESLGDELKKLCDQYTPTRNLLWIIDSERKQKSLEESAKSKITVKELKEFVNRFIQKVETLGKTPIQKGKRR